MISEFYHTITRNDEDLDVLVEYRAIRCSGGPDVEVTSIILDGVETEVTQEELTEIYAACYDRVDEDFIDDAAGYGDYRYDLSRDYE